MGFLSSLFGIGKMNADPDQQRLARMLIEAAEDSSKHVDLVNWIIRQPWRASETRTRLAHATSIAKISSIPATYARVKEIARELHDASYRLG
jgi:hypothetical protein